MVGGVGGGGLRFTALLNVEWLMGHDDGDLGKGSEARFLPGIDDAKTRNACLVASIAKVEPRKSQIGPRHNLCDFFLFLIFYNIVFN